MTTGSPPSESLGACAASIAACGEADRGTLVLVRRPARRTRLRRRTHTRSSRQTRTYSDSKIHLDSKTKVGIFAFFLHELGRTRLTSIADLDAVQSAHVLGCAPCGEGSHDKRQPTWIFPLSVVAQFLGVTPCADSAKDAGGGHPTDRPAP